MADLERKVEEIDKKVDRLGDQVEENTGVLESVRERLAGQMLGDRFMGVPIWLWWTASLFFVIILLLATLAPNSDALVAMWEDLLQAIR